MNKIRSLKNETKNLSSPMRKKDYVNLYNPGFNSIQIFVLAMNALDIGREKNQEEGKNYASYMCNSDQHGRVRRTRTRGDSQARIEGTGYYTDK